MHEEDLEIAIEALKNIRDFDHAENCHYINGLQEFGCYDKSQAEIAAEALKKIDS